MIEIARSLAAAVMLALLTGVPAPAGPIGDSPAPAARGGPDSAAELLWRRAEEGEAWAQFNLATMYHRGEGVRQSDALAAYWYQQAARNREADLRFRAGLRLIELRMESVDAGAGARVALVIGNSAYRGTARLARSERDARDMAGLLRRLGFAVTLARDLDREAAVDSILDFASRSDGAEIAAVYYAGHGIWAGGEIHLVPIDARPRSSGDIRRETVALGIVLRAVENARRLGLVILDAGPGGASEHRPSGARPGAGPDDAPIVVAHAAGAGLGAAEAEGCNSPLTAALLEHLDDRGIDLGEAFRRVDAALMRRTQGRQRLVVAGSGAGSEIILAPGGEASRPGEETGAAGGRDGG
jgi:hypothetical protein